MARSWLRGGWAGDVAVGVGAGLLTVVVTALVAPPPPSPPLHIDTSRYLLLAADCASGDGCQAVPTSIPGLDHEAGGTRFFALLRSLGLSPTGQHLVLVLLLALSTGILAVWVRRRFPGAHALTASALFLAATLATLSAPRLWTPLLAPLPLVVHTIATVGMARTGKTAWAVLAATSLAILGDLHLAHGILAAPFLLVAAASLRRPLSGLVLALPAAAGIAALTAPETWVLLSSHLTSARVLAALAGALVLLALGHAGRRRFETLSVDARALTALRVTLVFAVVQLVLASLVLQKPLEPRYAYGVWPALIVLLAAPWRGDPQAPGRHEIRARLRTYAPVPAVLVLLAWLTEGRLEQALDCPMVPRYSYADVSVLAGDDALATRPFTRLAMRLRGPASWDLISALAVFAVRPDGRADPDDIEGEQDLRVIRVPGSGAEEAPAGWHELRTDTARLWIGPHDAWTRLPWLRGCFPPPNGEEECASLTTASWDDMGDAKSGRSRFAFPSLPSLEAAADRARRKGDVQVYRVDAPVVVGGADPWRIVEVPWAEPDRGPTWQVTAVDGVAYEGTLPGPCVRLLASDGAPGTVSFTTTYRGGEQRRFAPPSVIETGPGEAAVREAIRRVPVLWDQLLDRGTVCALW